MPDSATGRPAAVADLQSVQRILASEARDGFRDRVVIGGLDAFLDRLRSTGGSSPQVAAVAEVLSGYGRLDPTARERRLREALESLGAAAAALSTPATPVGPRSAPQTLAPIASQPGAGPPPGPVPPLRRPSPTAPASPGSLTTITPVSPPPDVALDTPIADLKGIGPKRATIYKRLGLVVVRDLLFHFPIRHLRYPRPSRIADLFFQSDGSVVGILERLEVEDLPRGLKRLRATIRDRTGSVTAVWLRRGFPNLGVRPTEPIAVSGKLLQTGRQLTFDNPDFERGDAPPLHTRGLVPVYPLTSGLFDKDLRSRVHWAVAHFADALPDPLPTSVRSRQDLLGTADALRALHFPSSLDAYERARQRFAFEELMTIQLVVLQRRRAWQEGGAPALPPRQEALASLEAGLPFALTGAQRRVLQEILADTAEPRPMTRLLQGEVGSGKTAVAALALVNAVANGAQGAMMAPTEILAEQHFTTLSRLYEAAGERLEASLGRRPVVRLLTGSVKGRTRDEVYQGAADGSIDLLVGTQALIQQALDFARLGLVIVDEQHRFGVKQRVTLRRKAQEAAGTPHLLVMTATPIPRTLALSLYGDLDLSAIDEMPPGRQEVKTVLLGTNERHLAYEKVRRQVAQERQAFIICPLVEESEVLEAKAATEEFERLRTGELQGLRLALLHGRMKSAEKDTIMRAFRDRAFDVLVSTAVVEVGVDIPNATVMLIEGAERFGLAQLHQFRGRVGRGEHASVCVLLSELSDPQTNERLRVVERSNSGLELAEHDLRLRGPGDYFGVRQSGFPDLKVARLDDALVVEAARSAAASILDQDPTLSLPEHATLAAHVAAFLERAGEPS